MFEKEKKEKVVSFRIETDLNERLKHLASNNDTTPSHLLRIEIKKLLNEGR